jgi:hypothetical protein
MQPGRAKLSYSDVISKWHVDPSKKIELPRQKTVCIRDSINDYQDLCCFGEIEKLKQVPVHLFTGKIINELIKYMNHKLQEIACWSLEDDKSEDTLANFAHRRQGILKCINYLKSLE